MEEIQQSNNTASNALRSVSSRYSFPRRYIVAILCFLVLFITEYMRVDFAAVILHSLTQNILSDTFYGNVAKLNFKELDMIETSFTCGYGIGLIPSAFLLMVFSAHKLMIVSVAVCSILHISMPYTFYHHYAVTAGINVFHGFAQSALLPSCIRICMQWAPSSEKTGLVTLVFCGSYLAPLLNMKLSKLLIGNMRGENIFFITGIAGLLWCLIWSSVGFESPSLDPNISQKELSFLKKSTLDANVPVTIKSIPLKSIFTALPVYGFWVAFAGYGAGYQLFVPSMYADVFLRFSDSLVWITHVGLFPLILGSGFLTDVLINKVITATCARKIFYCSASVLCGIILVIITEARFYTNWYMTLLHIGRGALGFAIPGLHVNCLDIGGRYACILIALGGTFSCVVEICIVRLISSFGHIFPFVICTIVFIFFSALVFGIIGSGDLQQWALTTNSSPPAHTVHSSANGEKYFPDTDTELNEALVTDSV